jgi:Flp pilus assembly protein TadD
MFFITTNVLAAGSSSSSSSSETKSNYDQAVKLIKSAKKNEKKGKKDKAQSNYEKALKLLIKSNKKKPNEADTLNYLGFTSRKLGDFDNGEKYYLQGLAVDPNHRGINEYLGELYVATNRHNLAVERLEVLKGCNCEEYEQLKAVIAGEKSKY